MENLSLQRVSGIGAILTGIVAIIGIILISSTDAMTAEDSAELFPVVHDDKAVIGAGIWMLTLAPVLLLGAVAGIYQKLRSAGDVLRIALIAVAVDALFIIISNVLALGVVYEVATPWVEGGSEAGSNLLVLGDTLMTMSLVIRVVGDALGLGIGILLFSIAILKTGLAPKWIGWLGLIAALGGWLGLFVSTSEVFGLLGLIGAIALFIWLIGMGVTMVRSSEA
ncbi:MAG: DUF4386 family protein [Dehalococcoidia bacterium]|nr:DUF4386 family protein [Dehalococcoidia bacterium]